jgi:hypothetical protein
MEPTNLIKIRNVLLYSDVEQAPAKTADLILALRTHNIGNYHIIDGSHNPTIVDQLRSNCFDFDFCVYPSLTLPVITWQEFYDDYERALQVVQTVDELLQSNLVLRTDLLY